MKEVKHIEQAESYDVEYHLDLKGGQFGRTHTRSFFFPEGSIFDLDVESTAPVNFMILHPEHRQNKEHKYSPRREGQSESTEGHHGGHYRHGQGHHGENKESEQTPAAAVPAPEKHESVLKKEVRVLAKGGRYDLIFTLPRNVTTPSRVTVRMNAHVKTLDISHSCPLRSSLTRGHRHVRLQKHAREHVVLAASPYARTSSLVYVRLVPREHKFVVVSAILFSVWAVLRLVARYLRAHSGPRTGKGKCFWSRLCRKNETVQYSPILQVEPQIQVVYPGNK